MRLHLTLVAAATLLAASSGRAPAQDASSLRLVPFPKKIALRDGTFDLKQASVLWTSLPEDSPAVQMILEESRRAGLAAPKVSLVAHARGFIRLGNAAAPGTGVPREGEPPKAELAREAYRLEIAPGAVECLGHGPPGALYAAQTLCQLIRANRVEETKLPCLRIEDWPSLRWRCAQDDMTRGPSSKLETLKRGVALGAFFKHNMWTYYMEHQYAFEKHPEIGPKDGSLTPDELKALVEFAGPYHTGILGNQQSFGHFAHILKHEKYAHLRENGGLLSPVKEETYQLLDDLYSEVCPLLPFEMFNVCCDETYGLGAGPSKELAAKIGVGGVYVQHVRRVHDLLRDKYRKRMMMWGDIILEHPDKLDQVPKDTVMLTWGYGPRESFEDQILPFKESGYEFFVCPGISNWSRILPDFGVATVNIQNFVRDGAKHGAIGMINTDWEDDGEALQGYRWHGHAWGGECAWNASATAPEDFNRRIGAVLFGEKGDHFGRAIELLQQTHRLPGMEGMNNRRFWENDFQPGRTAASVKASAERLLRLVRSAVEHLEACKKEATVNADLLDSFLHGARRMELIGTRMLDGLRAAELYARACELPAQEALPLLDEVERLVRANRDAHEALGREFERLWLADCKPYALDWTTKRYAAAVAWYDGVLARLAESRKAAGEGKPLLPPEKLGVTLPEKFTRRTRPHRIEPAPLTPDAAWQEPRATHRLGIVVKAGSAARGETPIELDVTLPENVKSRPIRAFVSAADAPKEVAAQLDPSDVPGKTHLTVVVPGPMAKGSESRIHVYLGLAEAPKPPAQAVKTSDGPDGMKHLENDRVRLLLGPEGAHVYRWEVKALDNRDLTQPGETGWAGFADTGGEHRGAPNKLVCTRRGPALVQYRCTDPTGLEKTINLFAGASWMEVVLNEPVTYYWDFDNPRNFSADGPAPGEYLFSNGQTGPVGRHADGVKAQVKAPRTHWAVKFNKEGLALGMIAPETAATFVVAPGAGAGGVGIEQSPPVGHFITYGGKYGGPVEGDPKFLMERLRQTLDFGNQPEVVLHAVQTRPN